MTRLGIDTKDRPGLRDAEGKGRIDYDAQRQRKSGPVNWGMVAAVLTIVGWLLAAANGAFGDYRNVVERVNTLETHRANDTQRQDRIEQKIDRLDDKLDRLLMERGK